MICPTCRYTYYYVGDKYLTEVCPICGAYGDFDKFRQAGGEPSK